jgi:orotate phosphoribosyltransferase
VQRRGAHVIGVGIVVARAQQDFGVPAYALLHLPMISYDAAECPQCRAGETVTDPGSRRA